ncbi:MAG: glycerol-3-phosphate acyltransferase [Candidatus Berkelbacteria bacterium]|nr:MAG: glycerol-3-phosphate acyltransferase [Candidatus Berkelbacteria bacterium]QQG51761.1 MAG: glycerol-3-phosphate acyltransferase [Candidatus Berkelbacteria bacterium]
MFSTYDRAFILGGFVIGSIPFGYLVCLVHGIDIRRYGSGNIGATNVERALEAVFGPKKAKGWGTAVMLLDAAKGFLPVFLYPLYGGFDHIWLVWVAIAALTGHMFSPFMRGRGGKGVATGFGITLALNWAVGLICFVVWLLVKLWAKAFGSWWLPERTAVASTAGVWLSVGLFIADAVISKSLVLDNLLVSGLIAVLVTLRHLGNYERLSELPRQRAP